MQFANYFFASIISFLGLLAGIILVKIAPEEQKPLEKYLEICRKMLLLLIFLFMAFYPYKNNFYLLILAAYLAFLFFIEYRLRDLLKKSIIAYNLLGIIFFLSANNQNLFLIESSLIMLYGIVAASMLYRKKENNWHNILLYNSGFILLANVLYFV